MADFTAIYDKLRASEMNNWVGGADPELVGDICTSILVRHVPIDGETKLLDFGCGIGRVMLAVLKQKPMVKSITGIDIVPKMVDFCRETIQTEFPNTNFEVAADTNDHYERYKDGRPPKSRAELTAAYGGQFDAAYAFSVFTHIDTGDFVSLLKFVGTMLKPGGRFFFTVFALTPYSRQMLKAGKAVSDFPNSKFTDGGKVFIGNKADKLAFIAYDISKIEEMVWAAGLIPCAIEYGEWRGGKLTNSFQDVIVCRKPLEGV